MVMLIQTEQRIVSKREIYGGVGIGKGGLSLLLGAGYKFAFRREVLEFRNLETRLA
jgi:hypothetical protein